MTKTMRSIRIFILALGIIMSASMVSCKKLLDTEPGEVLGDGQMYRNVYDADAAVIGIYGKFMGLASKYTILNELRGDLLDVTPNSDRYLNQLNSFSVQEGNPYADPRPFYEVILYCNDAMKNFKRMLDEGKLKQSEFDTRYSDIGALRSWIYLQLGIQYGEVPYVTEPIEKIDDLKNEALFPRLSFGQLLDQLIVFMEALPFKNDYPSGTTLLTSVDSYSTTKFFINKQMVLGDLHLWKGDYNAAARSYRAVLEYATSNYASGTDQYYEVYRMTYSYITGANWTNIFVQPYGERYSNYENIWMLPFDKNFKPENPFISLLANSGGGKYQVSPSALAINDWDSQMRSDATPYDLRGRGASWTFDNSKPVVKKQIAAYNSQTPFEKNGKWILYRAGALHLRFAEAANRDHQNKIAYAFLNNGIAGSFDRTPGVANRDVTNMMNSLDYPEPYNFDARNGDFPRFRSDWYRHTGIRNRAGVAQSAIAKSDSARFFDMSNPDWYTREVTDHHGLALFLEDRIVEEGALELAFEGYRWPDLLRVALRREKEAPGTGVTFLQSKINAKFAAKGIPAPDLSNKAKWYLPFKWN
ncbi:RagB/SusD family protein [Pararcticibacter amylolyticus]|uniref:RagB/SusD family protein n=2 Tax=Pararcticibacter amylolyticus TaxID=2173175 RepID=A0A2U2PC72_9SPHI|nr:RagB/SusD family protein [Pararcticibacter amylolyticus]